VVVPSRDYLSRKGVYALTMKDDTMEIVNFDALENREDMSAPHSVD
jgi:hypothetical protein